MRKLQSIGPRLGSKVDELRRQPEPASEKSDPLLGELFGSYILEDLLGSGGLGSVYLGRHRLLGTFVAVKIMPAEFEGDPSYAEQVKREAKSIFRLKHPHIVDFYEFGHVGEFYYLAAEFVDGLDLARALENYRRHGELIPVKDVVRIAGQVADALDYVHAHGVIHRDIKPSNILLDKRGHAVVTDFGMALVTSDDVEAVFLGTAYYISPEQAVSPANAVSQSDLYSLGVVLYEMLSGRLPFEGETPVTVALKHISEPPPSPRLATRGLPLAVEQVVLRALSKEAGARHQTGAELMADLEKAFEEPDADQLETAERAAAAAEEDVGEAPDASPATAQRRPVSVRSLIRRVRQERADRKATGPEQANGPGDLLAALRSLPGAPVVGRMAAVVALCAVLVVAALLGAPRLRGLRDRPAATPLLPAAVPPAPPNVRMIYDGTSVTLVNVSSAPISLDAVTFQSVSDGGTPVRAFSADSWSRFAISPITALPPGGCLQVIRSGTTRTRPAACDSVQGWVAPSNQQYFWIGGEDSSAFRIVQGDSIVYSCQIAHGQCEFYLPQP
jgi:hypothetical protein